MRTYGIIALLYVAGVGITYHFWRQFISQYRKFPNPRTIFLILMWPYGGIKALICYPFNDLVDNFRTQTTPIHEIQITPEARDAFLQAILADLKDDKDTNAKLH